MKFFYWNIPVFQVELYLEVKKYLSDFHTPKRKNATSFYVKTPRKVCIGYQIFNRSNRFNIGWCCCITNRPKMQWFKASTFLISYKISMGQLGGSRDLSWALLVSTGLTHVSADGLARDQLVKNDFCWKDNILLIYLQQTSRVHSHGSGRGTSIEVEMCKHFFKHFFCFVFAVVFFCHVADPRVRMQEDHDMKAQRVWIQGGPWWRPLVQSIHHR